MPKQRFLIPFLVGQEFLLALVHVDGTQHG